MSKKVVSGMNRNGVNGEKISLPHPKERGLKGASNAPREIVYTISANIQYSFRKC